MNRPHIHRRSLQSETPQAAVSPRRRSLSSVSLRLNETSSVYELMRELVDGVTTAIQSAAGLVCLFSPALRTYAKYRKPSEALERFERTLGNETESLRGLLSSQQHHLLERDGLLFAPMYWNKELAGVLVLDRSLKKLAPQHRVGIMTICNQVAAIVCLRQQMQTEQPPEMQIRRQEIEGAVALQQSLLPVVPTYISGLQVAAHTQPANFVSGDYYDLISVSREKLGIIIADVEGKGMPGALFANLLRSTAHFLTRELPTTNAVVGKIHDILHKETEATRKFFTLFYALYDANAKRLCYTGSGQAAPVVVRGATAEIERLHSEGIPVGIDGQRLLSERSITLHKGDIVAFFTDGVLDARNREGRPFGEERLAALLQHSRSDDVEVILHTLLHAVTEYSNGKPGDDLTMIVMKVLE